MELIRIMDKEIVPIVIDGTPVLTLRQVDELHGRPEGTARKRLAENKARFVEGEDYMKISASVFRSRFPGALSDRATSDVTVVTESGYMMLTKSFTDDLAWKVQRTLVRDYFRAKELATAERPRLSGAFFSAEEQREIIQALTNYTKLLEAKLPKPRTKKKQTQPLTNEQACLIYDLEKQGLSREKIAKEVGVSTAMISYFLRFRPALPLA